MHFLIRYRYRASWLTKFITNTFQFKKPDCWNGRPTWQICDVWTTCATHYTVGFLYFIYWVHRKVHKINFCKVRNIGMQMDFYHFSALDFVFVFWVALFHYMGFVINFVDHLFSWSPMYYDDSCVVCWCKFLIQYLCKVIDIWAVVTYCCTENNAETAIAAIWFQFRFMNSLLSAKYGSAQTIYNNQLWTRALFLSRLGILCVFRGPCASYLICVGSSSLRSRAVEHDDVFPLYL